MVQFDLKASYVRQAQELVSRIAKLEGNCRGEAMMLAQLVASHLSKHWFDETREVRSAAATAAYNMKNRADVGSDPNVMYVAGVLETICEIAATIETDVRAQEERHLRMRLRFNMWNATMVTGSMAGFTAMTALEVLRCLKWGRRFGKSEMEVPLIWPVYH